MADDVSVWGSKSKMQTGTVTLSAVATTADATADITNSLGTDDVDVILSVKGSLAFGAGGENMTAAAVRVDGQLSYGGEGTKPTISAAPSTGNVRIYAKNNHTGTQDLTINYRLISRV